MLWKNSNKLSGQPSMLSNVFPCPFPPSIVSLGLLSALLPLSPEFTPSDVYLFQPPSYHLSAASGTLAAYWDLPGESLSTLKISLGPSSLCPSTLPSALMSPVSPASFLPEFRDALIPAKLWSRPQGWQSFSLFPIPCHESPSLSWIFHSSLRLSFHPDLDCLMLSSCLLCLAPASLLLPNLVMRQISHCLFVPWFNALCICLHIRMLV